MKTTSGLTGLLNYILYFPVNFVLVLVFYDFHKVEKQTPNKLAYYTLVCLIVIGILSYLMTFWSAVIAKSIKFLTI